MSLFRREQRAAEVQADSIVRSLLAGAEISPELAMQIPAFSAAVDWICGKIKSLSIKLYTERDGRTSEVMDDYRIRLLNDESDYDTMTAAEMKSGMIRDYLLYGRGYAFIDWSRNTVRGLHYVAASDVAYNSPLDPIFRSAAYYIGGREYAPYTLLRLLRHTRDGVSGRSIVEENSRLLSVAYASMLFEEKLVKSGGCRKAYIQSDKPLKDSALDTLKEAWRRLFSLDGDAAIALNAGVTVKEAASSPVELQMNENKRMNAANIYELLGLSADVIDGTASDEVISHAVQNAVIPIVTDFEAILNRNLLLESEKEKMYFAFDLKELLKGDIEKRYRAYQIALQTNFMQLDEVRYAEDLPPLGFNFIKLGLNDVLFDPKSKTVYTPNTNAMTKLDETAAAGEMSEARADNDRYIQGKDGKMNGSRPKNDTDGVDKSQKSGIIEVKENLGIKGDLVLNPKIPNLEKISFNSIHINNERKHNVTESEAKSYIMNSILSITRWNGRFINYYSLQGAAFIDTENNSIRTAFTFAEYDDKIKMLIKELNLIE